MNKTIALIIAGVLVSGIVSAITFEIVKNYVYDKKVPKIL